jgi:PPOX class probable F420-dependent enzyme
VFKPEDLAFLDEQRVARLATADAGGHPYVVPVCFARVGDRLFIPIDAKPKRGDPRNLKRVRNIRERPEAALLLDRFDEDWSRLRWLLIRAHALVLESGAQRAAALAALERRYRQYAAMGLGSLGLPVIGLEPISVSRWSGGHGDRAPT